MKVMRRLALGALVLANVPPASAMYEEEVGQYEWFLQNMGQPTVFASADSTDRVFVGTSAGTVASVHLKDGSMQWRRIGAAHEGSVRFLRVGGHSFLFSAMDSGLVQAWKGTTGDLIWQREYQEPVVDLQLLKNSLVVVRGAEVEARSLSGKHEWSIAAVALSAKARFWASAPSADETILCALAADPDGSGAVVIKLEAATGHVLKKVKLPAAEKSLKSGAFMVTDGNLVLLNGNTVAVHPICPEGEELTLELSKAKSTSSQPFKLLPWQLTRGVFAATNGATTAIIGLSSKGLKLLRSFQGLAVVGPVVSVHQDETGQPVAVAVVKEEGTQIQLLDPESGNVQPAVHVKGFTSTDHGNGKLILVHELASGEHRTVISTEDHSLALIQGSKVSWVREESLASVYQAEFYGRHAQVSAADRIANAETENGLMALGAQLSQMPETLGELAKQPLEIVATLTKWVTPKRLNRRQVTNLMPSVKLPTSSEELREFGADKLILALGGSSKLFALEATTSEVVWQRYLGGASCRVPAPGSDRIDNCSAWMQLLPSSASPSSELLVLGPVEENGNARTLYWLDPLTGKLLHQEAVPTAADVISIMPLHAHGGKLTEQAVLPVVLIDSTQRVFTLPSGSQEAAQFLEESHDGFFHYDVDTASQAVEGYVVGSTVGGTRHLSPLWNVELGSAGQQIVAVARPQHREWDHVPVHIKGDASILYKYINPNLLTIVTEDSSSLTVYGVDTVTGHVLHQNYLPGASGPAHVVSCDNWVVVHYRNAKRTRFEVLTIELFQAKADDGPWDILFGGKEANHTKSAHHLEMPVPLHQTYIVPSGVYAMGVTATLKGITPRSILMATTTEQIFRVSKDMLNPRRPYQGLAGEKDKAVPNQFAATKEEAVVPYAPLLPLRHTEVLNYHQALGAVSGIISSPTSLESTSLVLCYGLDLFFMPVQSAKAYDVLSPGFNYFLLYASVGFVVVTWIVTTIWAEHKTMQDRWK